MTKLFIIMAALGTLAVSSVYLLNSRDVFERKHIRLYFSFPVVPLAFLLASGGGGSLVCPADL